MIDDEQATWDHAYRQYLLRASLPLAHKLGPLVLFFMTFTFKHFFQRLNSSSKP